MFNRIKRIFNNLNIGLHIEYLYSHSLENIPDCIRPKDIVIHKLTIQDIHWLHDIWNVNLEQVKKRLIENHICYVSFIDGKPAGYHWVQQDGDHSIIPAGINIKIKQYESWIYHVRVANQFQGQGISSYVYQAILNEAKNNGQTKVYIYTSSQNTRNQRSLKKMGFILDFKFAALKVNKMYFNLSTHL